MADCERVNMAETVVAVDGPAGSGKSSVSKAAARRLGFAYLDTGAAYRALAWFVANRDLSPEDEQGVVGILPDWDYRIGLDPDDFFVRVGDHDVTQEIRMPEVSARVSSVARIPEVRERVNSIFRELIRSSTRAGIVVEGRDITTVVAPDAQVRLLLTAAEEVRAARRSAEVSGESTASTAEGLRKRDAADSRVVDFMEAADGVVTVDSTSLTFDQTVDAVIDLIREKTVRASDG